MTTPAIEKEYYNEIDKAFFKERLAGFINPTVAQFKKILKTYTLFNLFFTSLIFVEILYFFIHLTLLTQSFVMAIYLALIFATIFCYFTLRMYAHTRKIERLSGLKHQFLNACRRAVALPEEVPDLHQIIAEACCTLASELHGKESKIYPCPKQCSFLNSSFEKINCRLFWYDVHRMKELLLQASVDEHIKIVRLAPVDLEAHAGLANAYVMLSGLYVDPETLEASDDDNRAPRNKYHDDFNLKFRIIAERAIEEFKILSDYAPHDPWVHAQLAYSYHDLQMPQEEIKEYETIIDLCPEDRETLFKLGKLYFEHGQNAKGLQIYETLKHTNYKQAENLIGFYGAYSKTYSDTSY